MNDLLIRLYEYKDECMSMLSIYDNILRYDLHQFWRGKLDMVQVIINIIENELSEGW